MTATVHPVDRQGAEYLLVFALVGIPAWTSIMTHEGEWDAEGLATAFLPVVFPIVLMPWSYVWRTYVRRRHTQDARAEARALRTNG